MIGSVSCFYNGKLLTTRPLTEKKTLQHYKNNAQAVIIEGMRLGWDIPKLIKFNRDFIKKWRYEELKRKPDKEDLDLVLIAILILIKFKIIEEDGDQEGLLIIMPKKRNHPYQP
jgi:hypothetical protein